MNDYLCGAISGFSQTIVGHPFDTLKILKQTNKPININIKSLFAGIKYPLFSSSLICSFQFGIYEYYLKKDNNSFYSGFLSGLIISPLCFLWDIGKIKNQTNQTFFIKNILQEKGLFMTSARDSIALSIYFGTFEKVKENNISSFTGGAIAGVTNWTITYPLDVIRSRQIANKIDIIDAIKIKNYWRGYTSCMIRAMLVNSVGLSIYDYVKYL